MATQLKVPSGAHHVGDLRVTDEVWISGTVEGAITVEAGGTVAVTGVVTDMLVVGSHGAAYITGRVGELLVARSGEAVLDGTSNGNVQNWGRAIIAGTVGGQLVTHTGADTEVVSGAIVQNGSIEAGRFP